MTFRDISYKMFRANFRRYFLFFLCSSFTIMIFFAYSIIFTNRAFIYGHNVNSTISSMIIAPSYAIAVFSFFFITYAQTYFTKYRKYDFGMFMILGMTNRDIARIIVLENSCIGGGALLVGTLCGMFFSRVLSLLLAKIINLNGISFRLSYESFVYTTLFFLSIYVVSILLSLIASRKYEILTLLRETKHDDKNRFRSDIYAGLSIVLILTSILDGVFNYKINNESILLRSAICCFVGMYLFITNIGLILDKLYSISKRLYIKNIVFLTNLEHSLGQSKKIMFAIMILVFITIFFTNLPIALLYNAKGAAIAKNPYDVSYYEFMGRNKISEEKLGSILRSGQTQLTEYKKITFIDYRRIFLFSERELNQELHTDFNIAEGNYINLFLENFDYGYRHSLEDMQTLDIETSKGSAHLKSQGRFVGVIFAPTPAAYRYIILNDKDYFRIKAEMKETNLQVLRLFQFKDWKNTGSIVNELTEELRSYNESLDGTCFASVDIDRFVLRPASKIGLYEENIMGGRALLFYHSIISVLFFIASGIMLHFKQMTELEGEKKKYGKLNKIGITEWEIEKIVSKELLVLFFLPQALAIIAAIVYSCITPLYLKGQGSIAILSTLSIGLFYLGFQYMFFITYKKHYVRNFLN